MLKRVFKVFLLLLILLLAALVIKTFATGSLQIKDSYYEGPPLEMRSALPRLSRALQFRTISYDDSGDYPGKIRAIDSMIEWMERSYPAVFAHATATRISHSLLLTIGGTDQRLKPAMFLAHLDVVPVDSESEKKWHRPPFSGMIDKDTIYGRGVLDDKVIAIAMLEALEMELSQGRKPKRSIMFAFGHDEETGGRNGAMKIAAFLKQNGFKAEFICDEGFGIMEGLVPGLDRPAALLGIAEKGDLSVTLNIKIAGGHSSMPKKENATAILTKVLAKIESTTFYEGFCKPQQQFFRYLAPETPFHYRMLFSNLWLTGPLVKAVLKQNEKTTATIQTTHATTIMRAGEKDNVLPGEASAVVNFRLLPGQSLDELKSLLRKVVDDPRVTFSYSADETEPTPVSPTEGEGWNMITQTISESFDHVVVAPALTITGTDCKHYTGISDHIYRFTPLRLNNQNLGGIHGNNERLAVNNYFEVIRYYNLLFSKL